MAHDALLIEAEQFLNLLIQQATGKGGDNVEYVRLRAKYTRDPKLKDLVPRFVHVCRDLTHFWEFIKEKFAHYQERRDYLRAELQPLLDAIESGLSSPVQDAASAVLDKLDAAHVRDVWNKALTRAASDPDGAITAARALLESVCKLVLDELGVDYVDDGDLTKLHKTTAKTLKLSADQHQEEVFKQILGGCAGVVHGFAAMRNKLGDAHGPGKKLPVKAAPRHAQLAVNLAGAMAMFLLETFEANHGDKLKSKQQAAVDEPLF